MSTGKPGRAGHLVDAIRPSRRATRGRSRLVLRCNLGGVQLAQPLQPGCIGCRGCTQGREVTTLTIGVELRIVDHPADVALDGVQIQAALAAAAPHILRAGGEWADPLIRASRETAIADAVAAEREHILALVCDEIPPHMASKIERIARAGGTR